MTPILLAYYMYMPDRKYQLECMKNKAYSKWNKSLLDFILNVIHHFNRTRAQVATDWPYFLIELTLLLHINGRI